MKRCHQLEQSYPGAEQLRMQLSPIGWAVVALCGSDGQAGSAKALGHVCRALSMELKSGYMFEEMTYAARAAEQLYGDRKSTRLNSSHTDSSRMPSSA